MWKIKLRRIDIDEYFRQFLKWVTLCWDVGEFHSTLQTLGFAHVSRKILVIMKQTAISRWFSDSIAARLFQIDSHIGVVTS
jgi:hypothetical protein